METLGPISVLVAGSSAWVGHKLWVHGPRYSYDESVHWTKRWSVVNRNRFAMYASIAVCCSFFLSDIAANVAYTGFKLVEKTTGCKDDDGLVAAFALLPVFFYSEAVQAIFLKCSGYGFTASSLFTLWKMLHHRRF